MEPLYRGIVERARKYPTFWEFLQQHLTPKYLELHRQHLGEDEHYRAVLNSRGGIFDKNPALFTKLHEGLGLLAGISPDSKKRDPLLKELHVLRVNPKYAEELAHEMAIAAVGLEKVRGKPLWEVPLADAVSALKNAAWKIHKRYEEREPVLIGPGTIV